MKSKDLTHFSFLISHGRESRYGKKSDPVFGLIDCILIFRTLVQILKIKGSFGS